MKLDVDAMFDGCRAQHGVPDFEIAAADLEGLKLLAADAEANARAPQDALPAYTWIVNQIAIRVQLETRCRERPELRDARLSAPVFIVAPGRTGSTLLQWLLALHPTLRSPPLWELWRPMQADSEAGRREARAACDDAIQIMPPTALALHPMATDAPDECHWLMRHNSVRPGLHRAPAYSDWLWKLEAPMLTAQLQDYRLLVQMMQAAHPGRRWLSKTFAHALFWPVFFDVFPDARVIRIHRDPRQTIASSCSLFQNLTRGIDPVVMGEGIALSTGGGLWRMMQADARAPAGQVMDVLYEDLRAEPGKVACDVVRWLDLPEPEAFEGRVKQYLSGRRRIRAAPHAPSLAEFGLSGQDVLDYFEPYIAWARDRFDPAFCR